MRPYLRQGTASGTYSTKHLEYGWMSEPFTLYTKKRLKMKEKGADRRRIPRVG